MISLVIPVYNEKTSLEELLRRVVAVDMPKELVVVDDCSTDGSREILLALAERGLAGLHGARPVNENRLQVLFQEPNQGKGAALRRGFAAATGTVVVVQDADLEYDPREIPRLVAPIEDGHADVVYGSRFIGDTRRVLYYWHAVVNWGLTTLSNMTSGLNLTDMETCYKAFRRELIQSIRHRGGPVRVRAGDHREGGPRRRPRLRGAHQLPRAHLRGRQEDRLEGRLPRPLRHRQVLAEAVS